MTWFKIVVLLGLTAAASLGAVAIFTLIWQQYGLQTMGVCIIVTLALLFTIPATFVEVHDRHQRKMDGHYKILAERLEGSRQRYFGE